MRRLRSLPPTHPHSLIPFLPPSLSLPLSLFLPPPHPRVGEGGQDASGAGLARGRSLAPDCIPPYNTNQTASMCSTARVGVVTQAVLCSIPVYIPVYMCGVPVYIPVYMCGVPVYIPVYMCGVPVRRHLLLLSHETSSSSLPPSLPNSLPPSLPPSLIPSLPPFLPPSLPPYHYKNRPC
jgi:hypothetical protein